jgi:hypothetical protein
MPKEWKFPYCIVIIKGIYNEELNLYSLQNSIRMTKSMSMNWEGEIRNALKIFVGKP